MVLSDIVSNKGVTVRIFKTKWFTRFTRQENLDDTKLIEAVQNIENGLVDANYGGGMVKQRISKDGGGKVVDTGVLSLLNRKYAAYSSLHFLKTIRTTSLNLR
jgi:hypothetical protein